jgi:5-methyltetrahydropteroyltriglutamate--homocysteine methyltransferase
MSGHLKTTVVGSYPIPEWLKVFPSRQSLVDAIMVVLKTQELAGIDVVTDGELVRFDINHPESNGMIDYFLRPMSGIDTELTRAELEAYRRQETTAYRLRPAGIVRGPIGEGSLHLPEDFALVRRLTQKPLKFTVTSPFMLAQVLMDAYYHDRRRLTLTLAQVLANQVRSLRPEVLQIDEANVTGHPELSSLAAEAMNLVLDVVPQGVERGVHLCFGNYGGQTIQQGRWAQLVPFMNQLHCDHLVLEFARRRFEELSVVRDVRSEIKLGIGVIDIKDNQVESPEEVAQRIERVVRVVGEERLAYVHPDCGFWMLPRSIADRKMRNLVLGRDLFLGRQPGSGGVSWSSERAEATRGPRA